MQAERWNEIAEQVDFTLEPDLETFQNYLNAKARILDYGCGYGRVSASLYERGYKNIVGYDTSDQMVKRGKSQYPFLTLTLYERILPEADNSFDAIICCAVLTCLPSSKQQQQAVADLYRVLKPGGLLYLAEFSRTSNEGSNTNGVFMSGLGIEMKHFLPEEIRKLTRNFKHQQSHERQSYSINGKNLSSYHYFGLK